MHRREASEYRALPMPLQHRAAILRRSPELAPLCRLRCKSNALPGRWQLRATGMLSPTRPSDRVKGSLLGGAVGDALGAGIEFLSLDEIRQRFGLFGVQDFVPAYGRQGAITDDTQMTLFTAEGVVRSWVRMEERGICHIPSTVHHAYLRWLLTQGERPKKADFEIRTDGWLYGTTALHSRRAPGNTCLSALRAATGWGEPAVANNNSKGCGGVMRVAPIGLVTPSIGDDAQVFTLATEVAALTHGHPAGSLSAGHFALTIASLLRGEPLSQALDRADSELQKHSGHDQVTRALDAARVLAARGRPSPEQLESLGAGWVAEEALAIAVCCALVAQNFRDGVLLAVNHSGDSDSTGSMAGNLLGVQFGVDAIPHTWLEELELRSVIERLAIDLNALVSGKLTWPQACEAYPGN
jgi:ADP-ribosylglycohydrolase